MGPGRPIRLSRFGTQEPELSQKFGNAVAIFDDLDSDNGRPDPVEDEQHAIFDCPGYASARHIFHDLFGAQVGTVAQFLSQPDCNRIANFLTEMRANSA